VEGLKHEDVVQMMIGRRLEEFYPRRLDRAPGEELLSVQDFRSPGRFRGVSFRLRAGEVLGMAGLVGAGRTELAQALFGLDPESRGQVLVRGRPARINCPADALGLGLGLMPEDRKRHGLVLSLGGRANITLPTLERYARVGWVRQAAERSVAQEYFDLLRVRSPSLDAMAAGLSGGNQQKLVLARWLAANCRVLLLDEPTRGVDVGAKAEIHALIEKLAAEGRGVLLISSELPELIRLSNRVLVLRHGRLVGDVPRAQSDEQTLMRLMAGV
jgi:ABC-type sugar transport system ATPase subunit